MAAPNSFIARLCDPPTGSDTPTPTPERKPRKPKAKSKRKATSKRQLEANRRNAAKSTGPKTDAGKAASRENAAKHNLCARRIVLACEDEAEYRRHEQAIIRGWSPANDDELDMARRIARAGWILDRAEAIYNAMADLTITASKAEHKYPYPADHTRDLEFLAAGICHTDPEEARLVERYVVNADRSFHRHREALRKLQNDRFRRERLGQLPASADLLDPRTPTDNQANSVALEPAVSMYAAASAPLSENEIGFVAQFRDAVRNSLQPLEMRAAGTPDSDHLEKLTDTVFTGETLTHATVASHSIETLTSEPAAATSEQPHPQHDTSSDEGNPAQSVTPLSAELPPTDNAAHVVPVGGIGSMIDNILTPPSRNTQGVVTQAVRETNLTPDAHAFRGRIG